MSLPLNNCSIRGHESVNYPSTRCASPTRWLQHKNFTLSGAAHNVGDKVPIRHRSPEHNTDFGRINMVEGQQLRVKQVLILRRKYYSESFQLSYGGNYLTIVPNMSKSNLEKAWEVARKRNLRLKMKKMSFSRTSLLTSMLLLIALRSLFL